MEVEQSSALLEGILETLKSINTGLQAQEKKWEWLEGRLEHNKDLEKEKLNQNERVSQQEERAEQGSLMPVYESFHRSPDAVLFVDRAKVSPLEDSIIEGPEEPTFDEVDVPKFPMSSGSVALSIGRPSSPVDSLEEIHKSFAWDIETKAKKVSLIPYLDWRSPLADSPLRQNQEIQKVLGDAWMIPEDGRLPLLFSREYLEKLDGPQLKEHLPIMAAFRDKMKTDSFVDFKIVDQYKPSRYGRKEGQVTYRLGEPMKVKGKLQVPIVEVDDPAPPLLPFFRRTDDYYRNAPWRRFIFCQGLTTSRLDFETLGLKGRGRYNNAAPFLSADVGNSGWNYYFFSVNSHMRCERLMFSLARRVDVNPYTDITVGFHITFFEILPSYESKHPKFNERGSWKHGPLYDSAEDKLCESAFTLIEIPGDRPYLPQKTLPDESWTVMVVTPPRFTARRLSTPYPLDGPMHSTALILLRECFVSVLGNWNRLRDHLNDLLDEGDALFNPSDHDRLLWDDEIFSRSRKYFWAIHCLTEFHLSISDNILQWENYNDARIEPLRKAKALSHDDLRNLKLLEDSYVALKHVRLYFSEKLTSTKALRDGLFNASAVVESRASTRLGENVKLLTLVSIFFLPLAFCTSLWSVNNMFPMTTFIYTIIIVGLSTYLIVFNLNNLVLQASKIYQSLRDQLIKRMKDNDGDEWGFWSFKGKRFDVFRPHHEKAHPSEWWIVIFVFHIILKRVTSIVLPKRANKDGEETESENSLSFLSSKSSRSSMSEGYRSSSASTASRNSLDSPNEANNTVGVEFRPNPSTNVVAVDEMAPSPATTDRVLTTSLQGTRVNSLPVCSTTINTAGTESIFTPARNEPTERDHQGMPSTRSEAPQPSEKHRDVAGKTLSKLFRSKQRKFTVEDIAIV